MSEELKRSLNQCLYQLTSNCDPEFNEERGAFLIQKEGTEEFEAHWVRNTNTGTPVAWGLFTADRAEYGEKVLQKTLAGAWVEYASFHTHPKGCGPHPSLMDLTQLFTGFNINYIYAPDQNVLMRYRFDTTKKIWLSKVITITPPSPNPPSTPSPSPAPGALARS